MFQVSFTAQDFSHATYFCVNVFYNLDTGAITNTNPMVTSDVSVLNGGVAIRGDPCLSGSDCASDLYCDEKSTVCKTKDKSADESVFKKCSCNVVHAAECAGAVATCAVACIGSFGVACLTCIDTIAGCCDCASAAFGFDCSHC